MNYYSYDIWNSPTRVGLVTKIVYKDTNYQIKISYKGSHRLTLTGSTEGDRSDFILRSLKKFERSAKFEPISKFISTLKQLHLDQKLGF